MEAIDQIEGDDSYLDYLDILLGPADSLTNRYFSSINFLHFLLFYFNFVFYIIDFSLSSLEPIGACILCKKKKERKRKVFVVLILIMWINLIGILAVLKS